MTLKSLPGGVSLIDPIKFDISILPVTGLLTTNGEQFLTVVTNQTVTYDDLFSIDTDTYFPDAKGKLARVYAYLSFDVKGGSNAPVVTYKAEFKKANDSSWTIMSAQETYATTTSYINKYLEGDISLSAVDYAPFDIRIQFKSNGATANDLVSAKLKNDTLIRLVGSRERR